MSTERATRMFDGFVNAQTIGMIASIPTKALFEAQKQANYDYIGYLYQVMFDADGRLRMVNFQYSEISSDGGGVNRFISVPLLAIISHPCIGVRDAKVSYDVRVHDSQEDNTKITSENEVNGGGSMSGGWWGISASAHWGFKFSLTAEHERKRKTDTTASFKMEINVDRIPPSEGMSKVLDALLAGAGGAKSEG